MKRLTGKQRRGLKVILSFAPRDFQPSAQAVEWFFARSDRGLKVEWSASSDYNDYTGILLAHHMMSGAQENMWLDGHISLDFPLGVLVQYIMDEEPVNEALLERAVELWRSVLPEGDPTVDFILSRKAIL